MPATIHCDTHGDQPAAWLCRHLATSCPTGVVVGGDLDAAAAVCATCDQRIEGSWSKLELDDVDVCCILCFGDAVARAQDLSGLPEPAELFATACTQMIERNRTFLEAIDHEAHASWAFTAERALEFLDADATPTIRCACDSVGSLDPAEGVWMWAWANDTLPAGMRGRAAVARSIGDRLGLGVLTAPTVPGVTRDAAWHLAQLGAWLVGAAASYQLEVDDLEAWVAIGAWERVQPTS